MDKLKPVFKIFGIIGNVVVALSVLITLAMAYIVFMPDTFPKPFYLMYGYPSTDAGGVTPASTGEHQTTAEGGEHSSGATNTEKVVDPPLKVTVSYEVKPGEGLMVPLDSQIINLAEPGGRRYIRLSVTIEFAPPEPEHYFSEDISEEEKKLLVEEFNTGIASKKAMMNDIVITLVSTKSYDELYTADGKVLIRQQILEQINERLDEYNAIAVYFTEFVVE